MSVLLIVSGWAFAAGGQEKSALVQGADVMVRETIDVLLTLPISKLELVPVGEVAFGAYRVVMQLQAESGARLEPVVIHKIDVGSDEESAA